MGLDQRALRPVAANARRLTAAPWIGLVTVLLLAAGLTGLETTPALWWDEGWALCVARTWVQAGHYACRLNGQLAPPYQSQPFPVVVPMALSFSVLGVGIWQARVVTVLITSVALWVLYGLVEKLFNRRVAIASFVLLVAFPGKWEIATLVIGRQVLGEMPALLYLLLGYTFFLWSLEKRPGFLLLAALAWGIALRTKQQVLPFWTVSLAVPFGLSVLRRRWRTAQFIAAAGLAAIVVALGVVEAENIARQRSFEWAALDLLGPQVRQQALVRRLNVHLGAAQYTLTNSLPIVLGLAYGGWVIARDSRREVESAADLVRAMLFWLAASWLCWYVLLSIGWSRYLFPAVFLGAPFLASLVHDLTAGFSARETLTRVLRLLAARRDRAALAAAGGLALCVVILVNPLSDLGYFALNTSAAPRQIAEYLNIRVAPDQTIETVESELFFMLDRPYHYATNYAQPVPSVGADFLVVGSFARSYHLYDGEVAGRSFRLIFGLDGYQVYERAK